MPAKTLVSSRDEIQEEPKKEKSRVTKAFTNRYPDAEIETVTPENFGEWMG